MADAGSEDESSAGENIDLASVPKKRRAGETAVSGDRFSTLKKNLQTGTYSSPSRERDRGARGEL